jgi:hypothetical protein
MTTYVSINAAQFAALDEAGGPAVLYVHIAAMIYCDQQRNDGFISRETVLSLCRNTTSEETATAIRVLLRRGFWARVGRSQYQIVDYTKYALPAAEIARTAEADRNKKARQRRHNEGDHSMCTDPRWCTAMRKAHNAGDHSLCKNPQYCDALRKAGKTVPVAAKKAEPFSEEQVRAMYIREDEAANAWGKARGLVDFDWDDDEARGDFFRAWNAAADGYFAFRAKEISRGTPAEVLERAFER